jgi:hypothetical protein
VPVSQYIRAADLEKITIKRSGKEKINFTKVSMIYLIQALKILQIQIPELIRKQKKELLTSYSPDPNK